MLKFLPRIIIVALIVITILSWGFRLVFLSQLAVTGDELRAAELKIEELQKENLTLQKKISELSALGNIESRALALGMTPSKSTEFLTPVPSAALLTSSKSL